MLGLSTRKHSGGRYAGDATHEVPEPLHYALWTRTEHLLIDRTELGEEVTSDFAEDILQLVETWNDCVGSLRE
jgi:hypothetical protein